MRVNQRRSQFLRAKSEDKINMWEPKRFVLDNGLAVVLCPRPQLSRAYVALMFAVASRHENKANNGITHVLEHMLFRGTASYKTATELNAAAESLGGYLEGATYRDHLLFATACHPTAVEKAVGILGELVQTPRYHAMEVERAILREEILEGLDHRGRSIDIDNLSHKVIFGDHGLGLPIEGTLKNLDKMTLEALEAHRQQYLVGSNAVLSIAGPIQSVKVLNAIEKALGQLPEGQPPLLPVSNPPKKTPQLHYVRDTASQVEMRLSFRAPGAFHPLYPAMVMLGRILTDGLSSRLHAELIDKRGLAYSLHAGITLYSDCSLFEFDATVAPHRAVQMVEAILDFVKKARYIHLRPNEWEHALRRYRYEMEFMGDSPFELAHWYGHASLFGLEKEITDLPARIKKVTEKQMQKAAAYVFQPEGLVLTAVGELARGQYKGIQEVLAKWK